MRIASGTLVSIVSLEIVRRPGVWTCRWQTLGGKVQTAVDRIMASHMMGVDLPSVIELFFLFSL